MFQDSDSLDASAPSGEVTDIGEELPDARARGAKGDGAGENMSVWYEKADHVDSDRDEGEEEEDGEEGCGEHCELSY